MEIRKVYLDNSATTFVSNDVLREMIPTFNSTFGNANSSNSYGREARALVDLSRERIAKAIGAKANEIYFTSGGTESNNWAIRGIAHKLKEKGNHIITSAIEHSSILESCKALEKEGFKVTYLKADASGIINLAELMHYIRKDTILISIMAANNEIGTIQNIQAIAQTAHEKGIIFHTDAVQAFGAINFHVEDMGIDVMSISSHKIYGPKGVGALYIREGVEIEPLIYGGEQEDGLRGGTSNVPGIVGFGKASEIAVRDMNINMHKIRGLRDYFLKALTAKVTNFTINGHPHQKLQGLLSITFEGVEGESLATLLDMKGIAISTGSACNGGSHRISHVLNAIGLDANQAKSTVRISIGKHNTKEELDYVVDAIAEAVERLRAMSPIRLKKKKLED